MHEYSLMQAMFDQMAGVMEKHHAQAIRRVRVRIGRLAGVDPGLFRTAYDVYRIRTFCADALLEIEDGPSDELILEQLELEVR